MAGKFVLGPTQEKWLNSLEEHPERQRKASLGTKSDDGSYHACCLGELCIISGLFEWRGNDLFENPRDKNMTPSRSYLVTTYEKLGLRNEGGASNEIVTIDHESYTSLALMNDSGITWPEIAKIVREKPERFFTKSY